MSRIVPLLLGFVAALPPGCGDREGRRETPGSAAPAAPQNVQVASVEVVPLGSAWKLTDFDLTAPAAVAAETPDGRMVARVESTGTGLESRSFRIIVQRAAGGPTTILKNDAVNVSALVWSPDGSAIAFCEGTLVFVSVRNGPPELLYSGPGGPYPGACTNLEWTEDSGELRFVQLEHAQDARLANPARVVLKLRRGPPAPDRPQR